MKLFTTWKTDGFVKFNIRIIIRVLIADYWDSNVIGGGERTDISVRIR